MVVLLRELRFDLTGFGVLQTALRATLYGNKTRIDVARLQRLASGFNRFTVDGLNGDTAVPPHQVRHHAGREMLLVMLYMMYDQNFMCCSLAMF
jgi:hypothetical protein